MLDTVLQTKLFVPPPRMGLVPRHRLLAQLNQSLSFDHKLTLVSAPAGFGKTTLLSEWIKQKAEGKRQKDETHHLLPFHVAWLSLDEGDNDPARFLLYFVAALNQVEVVENKLGESTLNLLQSNQLPPIEIVLTSLINDLITIPQKVIIVLDDYHVIDSDQVDGTVSFLLEHLPSQLHLVIATRVDPNLHLSRLRVRGQLAELRATDLRFTRDEAASFLNHTMGLNLSTADIVALETRTEGWIAGLQLAAISLRGSRDTSNLIQSFTGSHRLVLDYLIEEVIQQQPQDIQDFLLKTAVLHQLNAPLCNALTGQDNGQETLTYLDHANLFIMPLDGERHWYRYHHLFADLLRQRLRQKHQEQMTMLHDRASEWYAQNGFHDEAVEHALSASNFQKAANLVEQFTTNNPYLNEQAKFLRWLDKIPSAITATKPQLCIIYAAILFTHGRIEEADHFLQRAEQDLALTLEPAPPANTTSLNSEQLRFRARAAAIRSHIFSYYGDEKEAIQYAKLALDYLPESDATWRWSAYDSMGTIYSGIDVAAAYQARTNALEASKAAGNVYLMILASSRLIVILRDLGQLQEALDMCQWQMQLANENGLAKTAVVGWLYALWGELLAETNELDQAQQFAEKGVALTNQGSDIILLGSSYLCLMRVLFSKEAFDTAQEVIWKVDQLTHERELSPWTTTQMSAWQARIWLAQGQMNKVSLWLNSMQMDGELSRMHDFDYVVLARIFIAQNKLAEADKLLNRILEAAEIAGRTSKTIEILILQALAFQAGNKGKEALAKLNKALSLAQPGGYIRTFIDEGPPMADLLQTAVSRGLFPDYTKQLLAVFSQTHSSTLPFQPKIQELPLNIDQLSEREVEVLQHIATGLTNREIAARLFLSLNTVKVHTRNINSKLDVHNRTEAVAKARTLGILSD